MVGKVDLWQLALLTTGGDLPRIARCLSADETAIAAQFKFESDRTRYVLTRACLRQILARYTGLAPHELRFDYGRFGKPRLANRGQAGAIEFNVSHSNDWALVAVARGFPIGVDLEKIRPDLATREVAEQFFSRYEQAELAAIDENQRAAAFFKCWTSKEAYIKGLGSGLSVPLKEFDVCVRPDTPTRLLRPYAGTSLWWLHDVDTAPGYRAVLATAPLPSCITYRHEHLWKS
jgi:4'-phosphopantetheinyl transferase